MRWIDGRIVTAVLIGIVAGWLAVPVSAAPGNAPGGAPVVTFTSTSVTASGITPGASVVFYMVGLRPLGVRAEGVRHVEVVTDTAKTGSVTVTLADPIPGSTIWTVVDTTTASFTVARADGRPIDVGRRSPSELHRTADGVTSFNNPGLVLDLLYVHPGDGAWVWVPADTRVTAAAERIADVANARPIGTTKGKPKELKAGGVLIAIDMYRMTVLTERLDGALLGGAR